MGFHYVWLTIAVIVMGISSVNSASNNDCDSALGMETGVITDGMIKTSSDRNDTNKTQARYKCCQGNTVGAWCPDPDQEGKKWIEVNFPKPTGISAISIEFPSTVMDPKTATDYLKTYHIMFKPAGRKHLEYLGNDGNAAEFTGIDHNGRMNKIAFDPIVTDQLRLEVVSFKGDPCFRFELFGCKEEDLCPDGCDYGKCAARETCLCDPNFQGKFCELPIVPKTAYHTPLGMEDGRIQDSQLNVSSSKPGKGKEKARWNCCEGEDIGAWCPAVGDNNPYYEVTFPKPVPIGTISMDFPSRKSIGSTETTYLKTYDLEVWLDSLPRPIGTIQNLTAAFNSTTSVTTSLPPRTAAKIRIIPKTWAESPCFRFELYTNDPNDKCPLGCKNGGECVRRYTCNCAKGYYGTDCAYTKEQIEVDLQVTLTFKTIIGTTLVTPAYNLSLHGNPQLVDGRFGKALYLDGKSQFMEIKKKDMGCLVHVGRCQSGFTVSMDINFVSITEGMFVFSSGGENSSQSGISCHVQDSKFVVKVSTASRIWKGTFSVDRVRLHTWNTFVYSWSYAVGLSVNLNGRPVLFTTSSTLRPQPVYQSSNLVFGSTPIGTTTVYAQYILENLKTLYMSLNGRAGAGIAAPSAKRCLNNGTYTMEGKCQCPDGFDGEACEINESNIQNVNMTFVSEDNQTVSAVAGKWTPSGGPKFVMEKDIGLSVKIVDEKHHVIFTPNKVNPCLSNLDLCIKGVTYQINLKVTRWVENTYILSNGPNQQGIYGIFFFYGVTHLHVSFSTTTHMWFVRFPYLPELDVWHNVEFSWSHAEGLAIYLDNVVLGMDKTGTETEEPANQTLPLTIGNLNNKPKSNPGFEVANVQVWLATRTVLQKFRILEEASTIPPSTQLPSTTAHTRTENEIESTTRPIDPTTAGTEKVTEETHTTLTTISATKPAVLPTTHELNYTWSFEKVNSKNTLIVQKDVNLTLVGNLEVVEKEHHALHFTGLTDQFLDFSTYHRSCLNDVRLCANGYTISFKIKFTSLEENTYLLSTGGENPLGTGVAIVYRFGRLHFIMSYMSEIWFCHVSRPNLDTWMTFDVTWHVSSGLEVYMNNRLVDHTNVPVEYTKDHLVNVGKHFYFASSYTKVDLQQNFHGYLASISTWFVSRTVLVLQGILLPAITTPSPATTTQTTTGKVTSTKAPKTVTVAPSSPTPPVATTTTKAPATQTKAPTTQTEAPTTQTKAPTTIMTSPRDLTCPTGCVKKDTIVTEKPPKPEAPTMIIREPEQSNAYFVCKFSSSESTNLKHVVRWTIDGKELLSAKTLLDGKYSEAKLDPSKIIGTLFQKKVCCSVQNAYLGMCGGQYSDIVQSKCITPEIKLITNTLNIKEGFNTGKVQLSINVPPSTLCSLETGNQCHVEVLTKLEGSRYDKKCSSRPVPELLVLSQTVGTHYHSCGASFLNVNWNETLEIEVKAGIDGIYDRNQIRQIQVYIKISSLPLITLGHLKVTIIDGDIRAICTSTGDPHIQTFDGQRYNNYLEGELIMYRHKTRPYEIRSLTKRCSSRRARPTCNCGLAVKAGDDVITLSRCHITPDSHHHHHHRTPTMAIELYKNGVLTPGLTVRRLGCGQKYEVYLPTGTKASVQAAGSSFINFWITPSSADRESVTGLCGNFNGHRSDEYIGPDGTSFSKYLRYSQPDPYIAAWRMTETIFTGVPKIVEVEHQRYCNCFNPQEAPCGTTYDITTCFTKSAYDVTSELLKQAKAPRLNNRRRRAAPEAIEPPLVQQSNCSGGQWSLDGAKAYCTEYLQNSTAAMDCGTHFNISSEDRIDDCAEDLQCTDDVDYARSMIDDIISNCVEEVQKQDPSTTQGNTTLEHVTDLVKNLCVEDCQNGGSCAQGICSCLDGFSGVDCSVGRNSTPIVDPLPVDGEPCDIEREDNCMVVPVTGDNFIDSDDLKCELTYIKVADSVTPTTKTEIVNGTYLDISRVNCPITGAADSVKVKVTNNGRVFSPESYLHVVYDSKCQECHLDEKTFTAVCKNRENVCRINGKCYSNTETKPGDDCMICDLQQSKTGWSESKATSCKKSHSTTTETVKVSPAAVKDTGGLSETGKVVIAAVCSALGVCLIFMTILLCMRRNSLKQLHMRMEDLSVPSHRTVELHRERTDMIKPMIYTNQAFQEESIRS